MTLADFFVYLSWTLWALGIVGMIIVAFQKKRFDLLMLACIFLLLSFAVSQFAQMRRGNLEKYHSDAGQATHIIKPNPDCNDQLAKINRKLALEKRQRVLERNARLIREGKAPPSWTSGDLAF